MNKYIQKGWMVFPPESALIEWAKIARQEALAALKDPALDHWYQCERTWFVGLDALNNDARGCLAGSAPLSGKAVDFVTIHCGGWPSLHRAQLSGIFPGYPQPRAGESAAGFRYRRNRDAAHVDGIIGTGTPKRRYVEEPHAFILGVPLSRADENAAPLVVWEGSHEIMRKALREILLEGQPNDLATVDVTETYQAARRTVFETCPRVEVWGAPGSAMLLHRLTLHGVAPWEEGARSAPEGRLIAYFRPPMPGGVAAWIDAP